MNGDLPDWLDGGASHQGPPPPKRRSRRPWWIAGAACVVVAGAVFGLHLAGLGALPRGHQVPGARAGHRAGVARPPSGRTRPPRPRPGPVPYPVLIADAGNGRLLEVTPSGKVVWQFSLPAVGGVALHPNDVSFAAGGASVLVSAEHQDVVALVDFAKRTVRWTFGVPGQPGAGSVHLDYPDDPAVLPDGEVAVADIRNCREVLLDPAGHMRAALGDRQTNYCQTDVARGLLGYPNGSDPQPNGDLLMTFSSGDRIAMLTPSGKALWDVTAPDLYGGFASDATLAPGGAVIVCGYATPGSVVAFNPHTGAELWHYFVASGPGELSNPTVALPMPGGDVLVADSGNNRVVALDPTTGRIVWTYASGLRDPGGVALDVYHDWKTAK